MKQNQWYPFAMNLVVHDESVDGSVVFAHNDLSFLRGYVVL
jgi:hypothetical protein